MLGRLSPDPPTRVLNPGVRRMSRFVPVFLACFSPYLFVAPARAADVPAEHKPDPASVKWYEKGYRYEQAGWVVLHVEGDPYARGYQHGRLLSAEIAKY